MSLILEHSCFCCKCGSADFLLFCIHICCACKNLKMLEITSYLYRFGAGEFDWADFTPRLKQKTYEEIQEYGHTLTLKLSIP